MNNNCVLIIPRELCIGCGVCASVCPENAIHMQQDALTGTFFPSVNHSKCSNCDLCLSVCPAVNWSNTVRTKQNHYALGDYVQAYAAFSSDHKLRAAAASGGFTTSLLQSLLVQGYISGAIVSRRVKGDPFQTETIIARTPEEIDSCKGSIYSPVCFSEVFRNLKKISNEESLAVVGLPCHSQALSLLIDKIPSLRKKNILKISLVCGHAPTQNAYRYIMKRLGINETDVVDINNRGEGWPGFLRFQLKNGDIRRIPHGDALSWGMILSSPVFTPDACQLCPDPGGFAADIMVCDAWLPRYKKNKEGINLILTKTVLGDKMVHNAKNNRDIDLELIDIDDFLRANNRVFTAKTRNHNIAMRYLIGKNLTIFHKNIKEIEALGFMTIIKLKIYYFHIKFIKFMKLSKFSNHLPKALFFYFKVVQLLKR